MQSNAFNKRGKCAVSILMTMALVLNIVFKFPFNSFFNNIAVSAASITLETIADRFQKKMNDDLYWATAEGVKDITITSVNEDMWEDTSLHFVSWINEEDISKAEDKASDNAVGWRISPVGERSVLDSVYSSGEAVSDHAYSGAEKSDDNKLFYTIENDVALGYYRQYYVSTADQLTTLLYYYQNDFGSRLKGTANECGGTIANKLGIVLLNDIDLGGKNGSHWNGYKNVACNLEIDGQGHKIYNGYFSETNNEYFLFADKKFAIHDLTFSNMFIGRAGGMFGAAQLAYFNNVNWEHCLAAGVNGAKSGTSIVFANGYDYCHLKNCTIDNCYITGNSHSGLFASYNSSLSYNASRSYLGDTSAEVTSYYYTDVPDTIEEAERAWNGKSIEYNGAQCSLSPIYPTIYENCATVNSDVYDVGNEHSGTFISCMQSNIIFKNCFSNCTIYARGKQGVFLGAVIGSADGFYYPYNGEKTFVNVYFENCYTSGVIEGADRIGGFVGMVFDDTRAYQSLSSVRLKDDDGNNTNYYKVTDIKNSHRGKAIFLNCYSTSSVGMQYSNNYVGGFAGSVVGNVRADNPDDIQHLFINCYAAGEVGGITTETSTDSANTNRIGGFFGSYLNYVYPRNTCLDDLENDYQYLLEEATEYEPGKSVTFNTDPSSSSSPAYQWFSMKMDFSQYGSQTAELINCFYDKQTTAMRERDIGNYDNKTCLVGTMAGLTGVYTKTSSVKEVKGLADTPGIMSSSDWNYIEDYYPQLSDLTSYPDSLPEEAPLAEQMKYERQMKYYNYSLASTAAVLLDHYDEYLDKFGNLIKADYLVYDTVRDITGKFKFTTDYGREIAWNNDDEKNAENKFINTMDTEGVGFEITYKDVDGNTQAVHHNPYVMKIIQDPTDGNKYKCSEFAPGRQWVVVTAGNGGQTGKRELRLLPTAYLSAGGTLDVNVISDKNGDTGSLRNEIKLGDYNLPGFNHYAGVAYALTDKTRMSVFGTDQVVSSYNSSDKSSFALYGGYLLTGNSTAVGVNDSGQMYDQRFMVSGQKNNSDNGMTMVKVFNTSMEYISDNQYLLKQDKEITDTGELEKWSGKALFDVGDIGYYYMTYYWRLNDGRYLTDNKLVKIKSESHTVEIVTGIINEEHTVFDEPSVDGFKTAIDQYVTDDITSENVLDADGNLKLDENGEQVKIDTWDSCYPSKKKEFNPKSDDFDPEDFYNSYNKTTIYGGDEYYIKSNIITSTNGNSVVGWHRTPEYRLTTLIIEVQTPGGQWVEMARNVDDAESKLDFSKANYSYAFPGYKITQDPDTKLFTVTNSENNENSFFVQNGSSESGVENFIEFKFDTDPNVQMNFENVSNLRVTVLFRRNYADVQTEKQVLKLPDDYASIDVAESLSVQDKAYEVDNTGAESDDSRKAVISGDTLTYRMKLYNIGFYDSDTVNVYDLIPEGCKYVDNSMKIYRQEKDITSGTAKYDSLVAVTEVEGYNVKYENDSLQWTIPTVELDCDYYVEYKVTVDQLSPAITKRVLTNEAQWDFVMLNGDLSPDNEVTDSDTSINSYKDNSIFDMSFRADEIDEHYMSYEITFWHNQDKDGAEYQNIRFENELPEDFEFKEDSVIELWTVDVEGSETRIADENSTDIEIKRTESKFIVRGLDFDPDKTYKVRFVGSCPEPKPNKEITNKSSILYERVEDESNAQTLANSITWTKRLTNQVETDVTHLYINVEKRIEADDSSQTFLYMIERFDDRNDTNPAETFYTQIHCLKQADGTYSGNKFVQVDKRGYYRITEITGWSDTDYDFDSTEYRDTTAFKGTTVSGSVSRNNTTVSFVLPRYSYISGAFPTSMGTLVSDTYPMAIFINSESEYAYLSGQAYAENKFIRSD